MAFASKAQERRAKRLVSEGVIPQKTVDKHTKESEGKELPEVSATPAATRARRKKTKARLTEMFSQYAQRFEHPRSD